MKRILGISAFYHDSAAALLGDGEIIAAAQEERFSRKKHDARFPEQAIRFCLREAGIGIGAVDAVVYYDKPFLKFERLLETYLSFAPAGFQSFRLAMPIWLKEKLFLRKLLEEKLGEIAGGRFPAERLLFSEHHLSHAASAFYPSGFGEALILTMDGVGEWATTSAAMGRGNRIEMQRELQFPHSLGLLYSAFTYYTGFKVNSGEYKLMGLAPYGEPRYVAQILEHLVDLKPDGSFRLNMDYFDYCVGLTMTNGRFAALFGGPPRASSEQLTQKHMDLAASIQAVTEEIILRMTRALARETGARNLCLAGGVALNCVANGKVLRDGKFKSIWIQPAAGDAGGALGAAYAAHHRDSAGSAEPAPDGAADTMRGSYLGPAFTQPQIEAALRAAGAQFELLADERAVARECAGLLASEKALGWFQGRMEFGPRALGARSILADARSPRMQSTLNLKVKFRESFRPFAPAVLREDLEEWFEMNVDSPYMLLVSEVARKRSKPMTEAERSLFGIEKLNVARSEIPAVTHVDYSARVQTVHRETNPLFHSLLTEFKARTGCPVLVNTSFNVRGEPIVGTPLDAFRCFMGTEIEALSIGQCLLRKDAQNPALRQQYQDRFELD